MPQKGSLVKHGVNAVQTRSRSKSAGGPTSESTGTTPIGPCDMSGRNGSSQQKRRRRRRRGPSLQVITPQALEATALGWSIEFLRDAQLRDPNIGPVVVWAEQQKRPSWAEVEHLSPMLRALWMQFELDGCIVWNAHNTVLGERSASNIHRSCILRKNR